MNKLIVILGPTATGKSRMAMELAKLLPSEIVSADSMLIYKRMNIGTAKPIVEERSHIPHHMIDIVEPNEEFSVASYQDTAIPIIDNIMKLGKRPLLVGGTGLYIRAVTEQFYFVPAEDNVEFREQCQVEAERYGNQYLHNKLSRIDPITAKRLHFNDVRRIIRALEVHNITGKPLSDFPSKGEQRYDTLFFGLTTERSLLYEQINRRVDVMIEQGLVEEVRMLLKIGVSPNAQAMQAIGYKEIVQYINGLCSLAEAVASIKQGTRNYAKRQLTWFRRMSDIEWIRTDEKDLSEIVEFIYKKVAQKELS